jgi:hypothetical protein
LKSGTENAVHTVVEKRGCRPITFCRDRGVGGSDRPKNRRLACINCNKEKTNKAAAEFGYPDLQNSLEPSLKHTVAINALRWTLREKLGDGGLFVEVTSGADTARTRQMRGFPKTHCIDAACAGASGKSVEIDTGTQFLKIKACGRGRRQMCEIDARGFPRSIAKSK